MSHTGRASSRMSLLVLAMIGQIFCCGQEGAWVGHGNYSTPPHVIARGGDFIPGRRGSFWLNKSDAGPEPEGVPSW